ncbi:MAG TPA: hypothetical protein VEO20_00650 [Thermoplasmata archaeon]|nr:hypothetical protein [Thermoplasmata archaeon]
MTGEGENESCGDPKCVAAWDAVHFFQEIGKTHDPLAILTAELHLLRQAVEQLAMKVALEPTSPIAAMCPLGTLARS